MIVIYGINKIKKFRRPVIALGVFDGLHRGHQVILKAAAQKAKQIKGTSIVLTFSPHPKNRPSLYSLEHRLRLIQDSGIDICIVVNFNSGFAGISAVDFIQKILVQGLGANFIYVGKNFRFGYKAQGNYRLLKQEGLSNNFKVIGFKVLRSQGKIISSTVIRKLIKSAKLKTAQRLLGRPVSILGSVVKGSCLGRILGFPTANINPHHEIIPACGIYAVKVMVGEKLFSGICYIGRRPTLNPQNKSVRVEVHIFNFHRKIYGKIIEVKFIKLIRLDQQFASLEELARQIKKDILACRRILA